MKMGPCLHGASVPVWGARSGLRCVVRQARQVTSAMLLLLLGMAEPGALVAGAPGQRGIRLAARGARGA